MIGSLRGCVVERRHPSTVLLEVGGVGYLCAVTPPTFAELEPTTTVYLHVHHHIREDAQTLFGFLTRDEKDTFEQLISVHGVGPSLALSILAVHSPHSLVDVVATSDVAALTLVPGVGKKTAERLIIELRDRLPSPAFIELPGAGRLPTPAASPLDDATAALVALGFKPQDAGTLVRKVDAEGKTSEEIIRLALQQSAR